MIRIAIIALSIGLLASLQSDRNVYKQYIGGRAGFSYVKLVLYSDSSYTFLERFDTPGITRDSGNWKINQSLLVLSSAAKRQEKKMFNNELFIIQGQTVYLFNQEQDSTFNRLYRTLQERR